MSTSVPFKAEMTYLESLLIIHAPGDELRDYFLEI
jgi:hypothetical protein